MFCENCGNQIPDTAVFCTKCGAKVGKAQTEVSINQPIPPSQPAQPNPYKAAPVQTGSVQVGPVPPVTRPAPNVSPATRESGPEIPPAPAQPVQPAQPARPYVAASSQPAGPHAAAPGRPAQPYGAAPSQPAQPHGAAPGRPAQPYGATPGQTGSGPVSSDVMSYSQYLVMMLLTGIPIVNIILLIKWGFSNEVNPNKRNFSKAMLTFMAVAFIFGMIMWGSISKMLMRGMY